MQVANRLIDQVLGLHERIVGSHLYVFTVLPIEQSSSKSGLYTLHTEAEYREFKRGLGNALDPAYNYVYAPKRPLRAFNYLDKAYWKSIIDDGYDPSGLAKQKGPFYGYRKAFKDLSMKGYSERAAGWIVSELNTFKEEIVWIGDMLVASGFSSDLEEFHYNALTDGKEVYATNDMIRYSFKLVDGNAMRIEVSNDQYSGTIPDSLVAWLSAFQKGTVRGLSSEVARAASTMPKPSGPVKLYRGVAIPVKSDGTEESRIKNLISILRVFELDLNVHKGSYALVRSNQLGHSEVPFSSWSTDARVARSFMMARPNETDTVRMLFATTVSPDFILIDMTQLSAKAKLQLSGWAYENEVILKEEVAAKVIEVSIPDQLKQGLV